MSISVPFPDQQPAGYSWFEDEPEFDPDRDLALESPTEVVTLADLGYRPEQIEGTATPVAASAPFRVLSDDGARILLDICRRLRPFGQPAADRIEHMTRGGCYRSRWLRDLCLSPAVTEVMAAIYGAEVAPHSMPAHLGHVNFEPSDITRAVDKWHHDTLALDYVMVVTDPALVPGGRFEYFHGTKDEAAELAARGETPPSDRIVTPAVPGPGHAIALHGNMVVHRGGPLAAQAERITMVNGYVAMDRSLDDQMRTRDLFHVDPPHQLYAEWARHAAWRSAGRLEDLVATLPFTDDRDAVIAALEHSIEDVRRAIDEMSEGRSDDVTHYGG